MKHSVLLLTSALIITGCAKGRYKENSTPPADSATVVGKVQIWVTNGNQTKLLQKGADIDIKTGAAACTARRFSCIACR